MNEINEIKTAFDTLVRGAAKIRLSDEEQALYDVTVDLLFRQEEIGASAPTCEVPFTLRLKRAQLVATLKETSEIYILDTLTSEPDEDVIIDEIVDEKDNGVEVGMTPDGSVTAKTPKWKSTRKTQVKTTRRDIDFQNEPIRNPKIARFDIEPGKSSGGTLKGKPWSAKDVILLLRDQRDPRTRILDLQNDMQPAVSLSIRCKERDWDFDFGAEKSGLFGKRDKERTANEAAAKALIRKMLIEAGLQAGELGDGTAFFEMDFFEAKLP